MIESSAELQPPDVSSRPYVGWIPTVNGRLSFRHVGDTRQPEESIFANLDTGSDRIIVAYQHRPLSDVLFPKLIHWYRSISGSFWFTITARSNSAALSADRLNGAIHVFKSKDDWRAKANQQLRSQIRLLNALRRNHSSDRAHLANLAFDRATQLLDAEADICIQFDLERDGTVYFSNPAFKETALQEASERFASGDGHNIRKWVADQCYFFLRDATHSHQHHEPSSDTILILQDRDANDDVQWRRNIVYSLHYAIIRFKRDTDARSALRAKGILAYCDSFVAICKKALNGNFNDLPEFNNHALLLSLDAKAQEISTAEQIVSNRLNTELAKAIASRTISLAIVAIIIAAVAILIQPRVRPEDAIEFPLLWKTSTFAADNFFHFLGLTVVIVLVTWATTAFNLRLNNQQIGRSILEASYVKKRPAIAVFSLGTAVLLVITVWLFWPAVASLIETAKDFIKLVR